MSEDFADKTEAPTPRRREQFRREGKIAVSGDLNGAAVVITFVLLLSTIGSRLLDTLLDLVREGLIVSSSSASPAAMLGSVERTALVALLPLFLGVLAIAVLVNVAQIGLPLGFTLPRRDDRAGRPRISPLNALTSLLKIAALSFVGWKVLCSSLGLVTGSGGADFPRFAAMCLKVLLSAAMRIALVLLLFGLIDYAIQRYRLARELRMTRRELRDDLKHTEGDPELRKRRRKARLELAMSRSRDRHRVPFR